ncbi:MAG: nucleotidyltransferase domain-containing protein [Ignavibacteriales bacterium]|nr:nucleotidyltransferase domain-containing protein [Ignavibacteriales bacterium]
MLEKDVLEKIKNFINFLKDKKYKIKKIFLFGSYAKGNYNDDSDIDIAIVIDDMENFYLIQFELLLIGCKFDSRIEPYPFYSEDFNESNPFAKEIIKMELL